MRQVQVLYYGTVLAPGEGYDDPRVLAAAGPYAAFQLHLGELGVAGDSAECAGFGKALAEVDGEPRHLELHRGAPHRRDRTGPAVRHRRTDRPHHRQRNRRAGTGPTALGLAASGVRGVLYGPMGDDIPRELEAFADAATTARSA